MDMHLAFQNWMAGEPEVTEKILQRYQPVSSEATCVTLPGGCSNGCRKRRCVCASRWGCDGAAVSPDGRTLPPWARIK